MVLTGGEPMIFEGLVSLTERLLELGQLVTIETAGTAVLPIPREGVLMSISPKLSNSDPVGDARWEERHRLTRLNREPLRELVENYDFQLKFVVHPEAAEDFAEIDGILSDLPPIDAERIFLMPEGTDSAILKRRGQELVPIALERGWRIAPRYHIDLFGDTRGT